MINLFTLHKTAVTTGGAVCPSAGCSRNEPKGGQPVHSLRGVQLQLHLVLESISLSLSPVMPISHGILLLPCGLYEKGTEVVGGSRTPGKRVGVSVTP